MGEKSLTRLREIAKLLESNTNRASLLEEFEDIASELQTKLDKTRLDFRQNNEYLSQAGRLIELGTTAASIFHEMNQPLLGIKGFSELIQEHIERGSRDKIRFWSNEITNQVTRIMQLQDQVSTFLNSDHRQDECSSLQSAVDEALQLFQVRFEKKGIRLGISIPKDLCQVKISQQHLTQVFINLLVNATDALESQPAKRIQIIAQAVGNGQVRIVFADSGSGIPVENRDKIFTPFFTTKGKKGSGLGLFISHRLISQSGGKIQLIDPTSLGWKVLPSTAFEIWLQPNTTTALSNTTEELNDQTPQLVTHMRDIMGDSLLSQRVLVVDDEEVIRRILTEYFTSQGILVDVSASSEEALVKLGQQRYAVVITDKNLPGMDGIDLLDAIKKRWSKIEVLVITGYASVDSALDAIDRGAFDYIPKPFPSLSYIGNKTKAALERHQFEHRVHNAIDFLTRANENTFTKMGGADQKPLIVRLKEILASYENGDKNGIVLVRGPKTLLHTTQNLGYRTQQVANINEAMVQIKNCNVNVMVFAEDKAMQGFEAAQLVRDANPNVGVFVVGRETNLRRIVKAIGHGVGDYLILPVESKTMYAKRLTRLVERQKRMKRYRNLIDALQKLNSDLLNARLPEC